MFIVYGMLLSAARSQRTGNVFELPAEAACLAGRIRSLLHLDRTCSAMFPGPEVRAWPQEHVALRDQEEHHGEGVRVPETPP